MTQKRQEGDSAKNNASFGSVRTKSFDEIIQEQSKANFSK